MEISFMQNGTSENVAANFIPFYSFFDILAYPAFLNFFLLHRYQ